MSRVLAILPTVAAPALGEAARRVLVLGCPLALILAGRALPL